MTESGRKHTERDLGSEELWLQAAYEMLIESGVDAVKVMPLAKRLGVSRTSFYWHFESREALLDALLKRWSQRNTGCLIDQTEAFAECIAEAMLNVFDCWVGVELFDSRLDYAIRQWAQNDTAVMAMVKAADEQRMDALVDMFARHGFDQQQATSRAFTTYYTQIGYISMMVQESFLERIARIPAYVEVFTGSRPTDIQMARFKSRHRHLLED